MIVTERCTKLPRGVSVGTLYGGGGGGVSKQVFSYRWVYSKGSISWWDSED